MGTHHSKKVNAFRFASPQSLWAAPPRPGGPLLSSWSLISSAGSSAAGVQELMAAQDTWGALFLIKEQLLSV